MPVRVCYLSAQITLRARKHIFQPLNSSIETINCCGMFEKIGFYCSVQILIIYSAICTSNPIVGKSYKARIDEYPFAVSLSDSSDIVDKRNHFCGGTLISKRLVLTAAHCIRNLAENNVMVIIKTSDFNSGQIYKVKSWNTYDGWVLSRLLGGLKKNNTTRSSQSKGDTNVEPTRRSLLYNYYKMIGTNEVEDDDNNRITVITENDIAIITLSQDVEDVVPAKLTELHDYELIGKDAVTVGWGSISGPPKIIRPDSLLKVNLKILSPTEIRQNLYELFKQNLHLESNFYYTSADPPAVLGCGDSGGPLMLLSTKEIIGVNKGNCLAENLQINSYSMSRHVKLLDSYKEFIEDMKKQ